MLLCNILESGKSAICLDPEHELIGDVGVAVEELALRAPAQGMEPQQDLPEQFPAHQFLFNAGSVDKKFYMDNLQLEGSEYELIRYPQRGVCLYKCGKV